MISEEYRALNQALHRSRPSYGAGGHRWAWWCAGREDILDYGCGKGTLSEALNMDMAEYDPAIPGKDEPPGEHETVVCLDVLEHIEPEFLDDVLADIRRCMKRHGLLVIATRPAKKVLPDGRNAHLIIEDWEWWREKLEQHFIISTVLPAIQDGEYAVEVRV